MLKFEAKIHVDVNANVTCEHTLVSSIALYGNESVSI